MNKSHGNSHHPIYRAYYNWIRRLGGVDKAPPHLQPFEKFWKARHKSYKPGLVLGLDGRWQSRTQSAKHAWKKRHVTMDLTKQRTTMEQAFFLLNATKDDYVALVDLTELEPQA